MSDSIKSLFKFYEDMIQVMLVLKVFFYFVEDSQVEYLLGVALSRSENS